MEWNGYKEVFIPGAKPALQWHDPMVVHVKEREVRELFLEDEKERVEHI